MMTADEYKQIRQAIGTQREVASILGVTPETVCRRERGTLEIPTEARLALLMARLTHGRPNAML